MAVCSITQTAMDSPHVCQHCSGTFVLASSLRTHAAHVHGEGLQAFLTESGCHPSGVSGNHGDTTGDVKSNEIKREVCGSDCEAGVVKPSSFLVTDSQAQVVNVGVSGGHCKYVDVHSGNHGDTADDIKPAIAKAECDCEMDSSQYNTLVTGNQASVFSDVCAKNIRNSSGTHVATADDIKPDNIKKEIILLCGGDCEIDTVKPNAVSLVNVGVNGERCKHVDDSHSNNHGDTTDDIKPVFVKAEKMNCEMDDGQRNTLVTGNQVKVVGAAYEKNVSDSLNTRVDTAGHSKSEIAKMYDCEVDSGQYDTSVSGKQAKVVSDVHGKHVSNGSLTMHKRINGGDKPYACKVCKKRFNQPNSIKRHERIHTGDKPYVCNVCDKRFTQLCDMKRHGRIHTGDKPYACNICDKRFTQLCDMKKHERIHTGDKPYACSVCEKRFSSISNFMRHERIHTGDKPYACSVCEKRFNSISNFMRHERIHTGDKPYVCNVCDKCFMQFSQLKSHERVHTGDKPYVCNACDKRFKHLSHLKRHHGRFHSLGETFYAPQRK